MAIATPPLPWELQPSPDQGIWDAMKLRPIICVPVNIANTTKTIAEAPGVLIGWAFRETAAQATPVDFIDGRDTTGEQLGSTTLAASGANAQSVGVAGVLFRRGLTITATTGTIKGAVWVQL